MKTKHIEALGHFLAFYATDLNYINNFQKYKETPDDPNYTIKGIGTFYSFLVEFRVIRNIVSGSTKKILEETVNWVNGPNPDDVDAFAKQLSKTGLTHNKIPVSMASKILFLNNPWEIIPMDRLARKTLNLKENKYSVYKNKLIEFENDNKSTFKSSLNYTNPLTDIIHNEFNDIKNLSLICRNRIIDKLLWTMGNK